MANRLVLLIALGNALVAHRCYSSGDAGSAIAGAGLCMIAIALCIEGRRPSIEPSGTGPRRLLVRAFQEGQAEIRRQVIEELPSGRRAGDTSGHSSRR